MFTRDADRSLISASVGDHRDQVPGEPAVAGHADAEPGLGAGQPPLPVEETFLVAGEPVLVAREHACQGEVRGRGLQPRRVGGRVRPDVRHAPLGEDVHQRRPDQVLGLVFRAPVPGPQPHIGVNDLRVQSPSNSSWNVPRGGRGHHRATSQLVTRLQDSPLAVSGRQPGPGYGLAPGPG